MTAETSAAIDSGDLSPGCGTDSLPAPQRPFALRGVAERALYTDDDRRTP